ncbi:hypothetical protein ACO2KH_05520 [Leptospira terpstrae]|uniref:hypothetical protein n=1 Tax=Leptospira terpstrae TaxID=293075 RepID=UPI003D0542E9
MQRSKPSHRGLYESYLKRIYVLFANAIKEQFPSDSDDVCYTKAINLYSGLVGTLTMARTMKDPIKSREILLAGREFLKKNFLR